MVTDQVVRRTDGDRPGGQEGCCYYIKRLTKRVLLVFPESDSDSQHSRQLWGLDSDSDSDSQHSRQL